MDKLLFFKPNEPLEQVGTGVQRKCAVGRTANTRLDYQNENHPRVMIECSSGGWSDCPAMAIAETQVLPIKGHYRRLDNSNPFPATVVVDDEETQSIADKLKNIRKAFGVNKADLARMLNYSRTILYKWEKGDIPSLESQKRINTILQYAVQWKKQNPYHYPPNNLMRQTLEQTKSMIELLCEDPLSDQNIKNGFEELVALMKIRHKQMDEIARKSERSTVSDQEYRDRLSGLTDSIHFKDDDLS